MRFFLEASVEDMYDYLKSILKKVPRAIILHVGTNNFVNESSDNVLNKILSIFNFFFNGSRKIVKE